ncbi:uncharacterized protein LOC112058382 [Bicyclus anynana]|uniref:Uncharacterized protein LOC112058382 n=1 Tax=Bicyclus anynana TaxID=110368 RepID=A0ABM3LYK6_BICAN|nr:uncharacterized protein LOC112058382 [Bicyclus anynana]
MAFVLSLLLYTRFADIPTRVAIENQYASIHNMSFPAITICSPNQITISSAKHFQKTLVEGNITVDLKSVLPRLLGFYELFGDKRPEELANLQSLITLNRYSDLVFHKMMARPFGISAFSPYQIVQALEVMGMVPQSCEDFLKLCYLKQKPYPSCRGLFQPILTKHGMCCIFNSIYKYNYKTSFRNERVQNFEPYKASVGGMGDDLTVVTDYEPNNALSGTLVLAGAVRVRKIMFTEPNEFPADDESNLVHPYSESFHSIQATYTYCSDEVTTLPYWSRQCYFHDEYNLPYFKEFHNSECDLLCFVHAVESFCHCTMIYTPHLRAHRACNITSIDCIVQTTLEMNKWHRADSCECLRDCVSVRYHVEVSIGNLQALPYLVHNL